MTPTQAREFRRMILYVITLLGQPRSTARGRQGRGDRKTAHIFFPSGQLSKGGGPRRASRLNGQNRRVRVTWGRWGRPPPWKLTHPASRCQAPGAQVESHSQALHQGAQCWGPTTKEGAHSHSTSYPSSSTPLVVIGRQTPPLPGVKLRPKRRRARLWRIRRPRRIQGGGLQSEEGGHCRGSSPPLPAAHASPLSHQILSSPVPPNEREATLGAQGGRLVPRGSILKRGVLFRGRQVPNASRTGQDRQDPRNPRTASARRKRLWGLGQSPIRTGVQPDSHAPVAPPAVRPAAIGPPRLRVHSRYGASSSPTPSNIRGVRDSTCPATLENRVIGTESAPLRTLESFAGNPPNVGRKLGPRGQRAGSPCGNITWRAGRPSAIQRPWIVEHGLWIRGTWIVEHNVAPQRPGQTDG